LLRPEPTADGFESEERLVICGVSWERYLALDEALGDDRPGPRFYYLNGELEIMTTSNEHERIKKWIGDLMAVWFWRRQALEIFVLGDEGTAYKAVSQSRLLPSLDIALLGRCVAIRSWQQARRTFRAGPAESLDP
jgi:Uma2 family endonuclease